MRHANFEFSTLSTVGGVGFRDKEINTHSEFYSIVDNETSKHIDADMCIYYTIKLTMCIYFFVSKAYSSYSTQCRKLKISMSNGYKITHVIKYFMRL